jgi:hypothetical protein
MEPYRTFAFDVYCTKCKREDFTITEIKVKTDKAHTALIDDPEKDFYVFNAYGGNLFVTAKITCNGCGQEQWVLVGNKKPETISVALFSLFKQSQRT